MFFPGDYFSSKCGSTEIRNNATAICALTLSLGGTDRLEMIFIGTPKK